MSDRKLAKAVQALFSQMQKMSKTLTKGLIKWLLRTAMTLNRRFRSPAAGFVLPTVVMLLLVVSLTVGALVYRAYSRTTQVIGDNQQRVIYNAATPAVDRARAKLEALFDPNRDTRYPGGVPAENYLTGMLRDDGSYDVPKLVSGSDFYKLPDETRINLDGATKTGELSAPDNAWVFRTDTNGDGTVDATVVYSIILQSPADTTTGVAGSGMVSTSDTAKADSLVTRHGPLSNQIRGNCSVSSADQAYSAAQGWYEDTSSSATLRKNFQIDALVIPDSQSGTFTTLEMHHDRKLDRGNKWGAWFRTDLEIFPGSTFNWNGAMHTEGSLMIAPAGGSFTAYLVSSQASCLMSSASNSEITVADKPTSQSTDFLGLTISGNLKNNAYTIDPDSSKVHVWPAKTATPAGPKDSLDLKTGTDSAVNANLPGVVALDPVKLLTEDVSQARSTTDPTNRTANFDTTWQNEKSLGGRIYSKSEPKPYVDDLYRADDRWGPKPRYSDQIAVSGDVIGTLIPTTNTALVNNTPADPVNNPGGVGLDGYWERRAYNEGLRVIVGQRLELGNTNGWQTPPAPATLSATNLGDPLYPPTGYGTGGSAVTTLSHEARQRRTLRDNLAAVQATAIYHKDSGSSSFPVACLASTTHPGTAATLANSINFQLGQAGDPRNSYYSSTGVLVPKVSDFFTGYGTNGWEFAPPASSETAFVTSIASTAPLGKALRNLANFAGDPKGFFPPVQEAAAVHPYPNLAMWGNFSELRETLRRFDALGGNTTAYNQLSLADKTNLHTASCTVGMLAYNLDGVVGSAGLSGAFAGVNPNNGDKVSTGQSSISNFEDVAVPTYCKSGSGTSSNPYVCTAPPASVLKQGMSGKQYDLATLIETGTQFERDRKYGFAATPSSGTPVPFVYKGTANKYYSFLFPSECDPNNATNVLTSIYPSGNGLDDKKAGLALFCASGPKFPSLYYLFPKAAHKQDGTGVVAADTVTQPATDYPNDSYIKTTVNPVTGTGSVTYSVVGATVDDFSAVKIAPRNFASTTTYSDWLLPKPVTPGTTGANVSPNRIIAPDGTNKAVAFLDRAIFNGREAMTTRVMDIDLGMLRRTAIATGKPWLPVSGIVYAFREDAVREDGIARPASGTYTDARTLSAPTDPALQTTAAGAKLSIKQVDYTADPDRRPHGFRLRNGSQVKRNDTIVTAAADNTRGLSFFTDNPVYIQGPFNLHQDGADDATGGRLEEFVAAQQLPATGVYGDTEFYGRTTREPTFAKSGDRWRPSEILSDAVSILSDTFCDGSIQDTFTSTTTGGDSGATIDASIYNAPATSPPYPGLYGPGCTTSGKTSFLNQNRPKTASSTTWARENAADPTTITSTTRTSPVKIDRNGNPVKADGTAYASTSTSYYNFSEAKSRKAATATDVNVITVSGLIPSRPNQYNGGMHNFPRFLEDWGSKALRFAGSFLQLSFSNYATAPFDQEGWEPGATVTASEYNGYYSAPIRVWGYDPALQLAPAGPAAARFVTAGKTRNEFYNELPVNDPYIKKLCNAAKTSGVTGVPTTVNCPA